MKIVRFAGTISAVFLLAASLVYAPSAQSQAPSRENVAPLLPFPTDPNKRCDNIIQAFTLSVFTPTGRIVTVDNDVFDQDVTLTFSVESVVTSTTTFTAVHYIVDGVLQPTNGPEFFRGSGANIGFLTLTHSQIMHMGPGSHTVQPAVLVTGGGTSFLEFGCFTATNGL